MDRCSDQDVDGVGLWASANLSQDVGETAPIM